jgi:hypothetical protein
MNWFSNALRLGRADEDALGKIERLLAVRRRFRPFPLNSYEDSGAGLGDCQGRGRRPRP